MQQFMSINRTIELKKKKKIKVKIFNGKMH